MLGCIEAVTADRVTSFQGILFAERKWIAVQWALRTEHSHSRTIGRTLVRRRGLKSPGSPGSLG